MEKERKVITLRVSPELKFEIDKAVVAEGDCTVNSWLVKIIKQHLVKKERGKH
jgi:hypothetical protein